MTTFAEFDVPVLVPAGVSGGVHAAAALARPRLLLQARGRRDQRGVWRRRQRGQSVQGAGRGSGHHGVLQVNDFAVRRGIVRFRDGS